MKKAVCLLSGGLDSATALYWARRQGYEIAALTVEYGQLHEREIESARSIARGLGIAHTVTSISLPWKGSALLDKNIPMPADREESEMSREIPATYVPARNSIFLSLAASCAETLAAEAIVIGANALDYSGYPDCRPEFLRAFEQVIRQGTKAGAEGKKTAIEAPLLKLGKKEIVLLAEKLVVPFEKTWSCYQGGDWPCGSCDSCLLRAKGFREANLKDPLIIHHEISGHS